MDWSDELAFDHGFNPEKDIVVKEEDFDADGYFSGIFDFGDFGVSASRASSAQQIASISRRTNSLPTELLQCLFPHCTFSTYFWCELRCHESSHRNNCGNFACTNPNCQYVCNSSVAMKDHLQRCHSSARLGCECGSTFQDVTNFRIHQRYCPVEIKKKEMGERTASALDKPSSSGGPFPLKIKFSKAVFKDQPLSSSLPQRQRRRAFNFPDSRTPNGAARCSTSFPGQCSVAAMTPSNFTNYRPTPDPVFKSGFLDFSQDNVSPETQGYDDWNEVPLIIDSRVTKPKPVDRVATISNDGNMNHIQLDCISPVVNGSENDDLLDKTDHEGHDWDATDRFSDIDETTTCGLPSPEMDNYEQGETAWTASSVSPSALFHAAFI